MPSKTSKRLVIDASVARAAGGETAIHPVSKLCRDFLMATLEICHRVVMTPEISMEWKRHESNFSRRWRVSMVARKKVCRRSTTTAYDGLYERIEALAATIREREAVHKDFCLIEAALDTDRTVVSLDEVVRALFARISRSEVDLQQIQWVNPAVEELGCLVWLKDGANFEEWLCLGFVPDAD